MVTLAEFTHSYGSSMNRLLDVGWTHSDVETLLADWPGIRFAYSHVLAQTAWRLTYEGAAPRQARAWMRALYEVEEGCPVMTDEVRQRLPCPPTPARPNTDPRVLVSAYREAAGGDPEMALLAWHAGVEPAELTDGLADGRCGRDALAMMAGLRAGS